MQGRPSRRDFLKLGGLGLAGLAFAPRKQAEDADGSGVQRLGQRALQYTSFNLLLTFVLGWSTWLPRLIFVPYLVQWLETIWGVTHPATGWKPTAIGIRQLIVSTLFTGLFIIFWRL